MVDLCVSLSLVFDRVKKKNGYARWGVSLDDDEDLLEMAKTIIVENRPLV